MTASDAAKITTRPEEVSPEQVDAWLKGWHQTIQAAAKDRRHQAFERDVPVPRTPISPAAKAAALDRLKADGFTAERIGDGEVIVSWPVVPTPTESPKLDA